MHQCPDCGASVALHTCDDLFQELLALDHSRRAPWGPLHGIAVACFLLQHSSRLGEDDRHLYWSMLHAYLSGGLASVAPMTDRVRQLNSHRRGGLTPEPADFPGAPPFPGAMPPRDYATTIADVALGGSFSAAGYDRRVHTWAEDTIRAWQSAT